MERHCDFFEYFRVLFFSTEPFNVQTRLESLNAQQDAKLGIAHLFGAKISQIFKYHIYHNYPNKAARKFDCSARCKGIAQLRTSLEQKYHEGKVRIPLSNRFRIV